MTKSNTTAHEGISPGEQEIPVEDLIREDSVDSGQLFKARKQVIETMVKDRVKRGMSEDAARAEAEVMVSKVILQKKEEETYRHGEFDYDFLKMYMHDSFLGSVSLEVTKIPDTSMPTAYVGVRPNGKGHEIILGFNPKFFRSLNSKQRQGVIKHEMYHLVFQHIFDRAVGDKEYQTLWNWATDLAINSIIGKDNLPDACLIPGSAPIDPKTGKEVPGPYGEFIKNAPALKASDYYFEELRKIQQKNGNSSVSVAIGDGMGTLDDHDKWDDLPAEVRDAIRDKVHGMLDNAVKKAERNNDWGSVPFEVQEVIRKLLSREIDWRSIVHNFIGRCRTTDRISTIRRINKKSPYMFPGVKRKHVATFACFIDQSGSMSDDDISMLFSELEAFAQHTQLDVLHFDTEVDENSHTVWKKGRPFPPARRTRCGGTSFQCVADFCNRQENRGRWSGVVILTDGYAPGMGQIVGSRVLWVITEGGTKDSISSGDLAVQMKESKQFTRY